MINLQYHNRATKKGKVMRGRNSFYLLSALGCLALFTPNSNAMEEDAVSSYRVQTFSVAKSQGSGAAHQELERQSKVAPVMKNFAAYLVQEDGSAWIRGQLKCKDEHAANQLVK